jgi:hypothetical protein
MLSSNEINFSALGNKKTAVFLIMQDEKTTYHRLISIFVKQCYEQLIISAQNNPGKKLPLRVNFLLDEFSTLPKINDFSAMITASRSRNIRFNLIVQSFKQFETKYGYEAFTIRGNCSNLIFLASRELSLLTEMSELAGIRETGEPLISISALQALRKDKGEALVFHDRLYPFLTELLDIDDYFKLLTTSTTEVKYPKQHSTYSPEFNFYYFYETHNDTYLAKLFCEGYTPKGSVKNNTEREIGKGKTRIMLDMPDLRVLGISEFDLKMVIAFDLFKNRILDPAEAAKLPGISRRMFIKKLVKYDINGLAYLEHQKTKNDTE